MQDKEKSPSIKTGPTPVLGVHPSDKDKSKGYLFPTDKSTIVPNAELARGGSSFHSSFLQILGETQHTEKPSPSPDWYPDNPFQGLLSFTNLNTAQHNQMFSIFSQQDPTEPTPSTDMGTPVDLFSGKLKLIQEKSKAERVSFTDVDRSKIVLSKGSGFHNPSLDLNSGKINPLIKKPSLPEKAASMRNFSGKQRSLHIPTPPAKIIYNPSSQSQLKPSSIQPSNENSPKKSSKLQCKSCLIPSTSSKNPSMQSTNSKEVFSTMPSANLYYQHGLSSKFRPTPLKSNSKNNALTIEETQRLKSFKPTPSITPKVQPQNPTKAKPSLPEYPFQSFRANLDNQCEVRELDDDRFADYTQLKMNTSTSRLVAAEGHNPSNTSFLCRQFPTIQKLLEFNQKCSADETSDHSLLKNRIISKLYKDKMDKIQNQLNKKGIRAATPGRRPAIVSTRVETLQAPARKGTMSAKSHFSGKNEPSVQIGSLYTEGSVQSQRGPYTQRMVNYLKQSRALSNVDTIKFMGQEVLDSTGSQNIKRLLEQRLYKHN